MDALVFDGARLVAVDDVESPKWFFVFDRSVDGEPRHVATVDLDQGPNESTLHGATVSSRWVALRSHSRHRAGVFRIVTVFTRDTLKLCGRLSEGRGTNVWGGPGTDDCWGGAAFLGERLLVAAYREGLLEVDCSTLSGDGEQRRWDFALAERSRTVAIPGAQRVVDVIPVERWGGALVIATNDDVRCAVWHRAG